MRNTYHSLLPGLRKFWFALLAGLFAVTVTTLLMLEDFTCDRLSICFLQQETLKLADRIDTQVALVELETARAEPGAEAAKDGVLLAPVGAKGLFLSKLPVTQETRLNLDPATEADLSFARDTLRALPPSALAHLAKTFPDALRVDTTILDDIRAQTILRDAPKDCHALDDAGWRLNTRRDLGVPPARSEILTLSLLSYAMSCDRADLPGLTAAESDS